jgi:hypothetical protein
MGDTSADSSTAGTALLQEVERVVASSHGVYICVTLAEEHVLSARRTASGMLSAELWGLSNTFIPPFTTCARLQLAASSSKRKQWSSAKC